MQIGLVQYSPLWENPEANIKKIETLIETTNLIGTSLLIFPELSLSGFTMNSKKFAEEIDGISSLFFMNLAKKLRMHIFAGIIEKDGDKIYNSLVHFDEKGLIRIRYRKIHPFTISGESINYNSGNDIATTKIEEFTFGLSICYDLRFPELYRKYAKRNVDCLVNIANWPDDRITHWDILLKARAIENQNFMIGVNRIGEDPKLKYPGHSSIISPMGRIIAKSVREEILISEINISEVKEVRTKLPFMQDIKLI